MVDHDTGRVSRVERLRGAAQALVSLCDHANVGAWKNGAVVNGGLDDGEVEFRRVVDEMRRVLKSTPPPAVMEAELQFLIAACDLGAILLTPPYSGLKEASAVFARKYDAYVDAIVAPWPGDGDTHES